jgi:hypothetical protein
MQQTPEEERELRRDEQTKEHEHAKGNEALDFRVASQPRFRHNAALD